MTGQSSFFEEQWPSEESEADALPGQGKIYFVETADGQYIVRQLTRDGKNGERRTKKSEPGTQAHMVIVGLGYAERNEYVEDLFEMRSGQDMQSLIARQGAAVRWAKKKKGAKP